jgi:hypothetical protein
LPEELRNWGIFSVGRSHRPTDFVPALYLHATGSSSSSERLYEFRNVVIFLSALKKDTVVKFYNPRFDSSPNPTVSVFMDKWPNKQMRSIQVAVTFTALMYY